MSNKWIDKIKILNINYLISRYFSPIVEKLSITKFYLSHFIDNNIFKNWKEEKIYDILIYGSLDEKIYPLRNKIYQLLKNNSEFKIKILQHPGYSSNFKGYTETELSKIINQSWLTVCTSSINQSFLKKYIEVVFSHSFIIGNIPPKYENIIQDNYLNINLNDSNDNIFKKIREILINKDLLKMKIKKNYDVFLNNYSYQKGLIQFEKIIDEIKIN